MEARAHDRGGRPAGPIDRSEHELADWEILTDALNVTLTRKRVYRVDEHRRAIESITPERYERLAYYERWLTATEKLLVEKGIVTSEEIEAKARSLEADR